MIKKYAVILFLLLLVGFLPNRSAAAETLKPTDSFYINDFANVIDGKVEDEIIQYGNQLYEETGAQVVLVTIDFTNGESLEEYAINLFNEWGIGSADNNNGVLILMSIGDDDYWTMQGEGLEDTFTSGEISGILQEYLEPDFAAKDYSAGAEKTYGAFIERLGGQWMVSTDATETAEDVVIDQYVFDEAGILSSEAKEYIDSKSSELKEYYNAGFYVITKDRYDEGLSILDDAIKSFVNNNASERDLILLLYKEDDNYWLLPGEDAEGFATVEVLSEVLDNVLEPEFAVKDYSQGAIDTADRIYELVQNNYRPVKTKTKGNSETTSVHNTTFGEEENSLDLNVVFGFFVFIIVMLFISKIGRRRRYRRTYGDSYDRYPYRQDRMHGPGGNWGHPGPSHGGSGGFHSNVDNEPEPKGAGRSFFGGSGAGRSSGGGSGFSGSSFGGGGSSRGGGAGRSSGGFGGSRSSGRSSGGGRSSSGGGGASRGGGAGRKK